MSEVYPKTGWSRGQRLFLWAVVLLGTVAFCIVSRTWRDVPHIIYDLSAAPPTFAFLAAVLIEGVSRRWQLSWWCWGWVLVPLSTVPAAAQFLGWPISGHLTCLLIAAPGLTIRRDLHPLAGVAAWLALAPVLAIRWYVFDPEFGSHLRTRNAVLVAAACLLVTALLCRMAQRSRLVGSNRREADGMSYVDVAIEGLSPRECRKVLEGALRALPPTERPQIEFEETEREARGIESVATVVAVLPPTLGIIASLLSIMSSRLALRKAKLRERVVVVTFKDGATQRIPLNSEGCEIPQVESFDPETVESIRVL